MDAQSWSIIIGAIGVILVKLWSMWLDYQRGKDAASQVDKVKVQAVLAANKVDQVSQQLAKSDSSHAATLETVLTKVEEVRHATNSLTDRLIETTRTEAHALGVKEEKEKGERP